MPSSAQWLPAASGPGSETECTVPRWLRNGSSPGATCEGCGEADGPFEPVHRAYLEADEDGHLRLAQTMPEVERSVPCLPGRLPQRAGRELNGVTRSTSVIDYRGRYAFDVAPDVICSHRAQRALRELVGVVACVPARGPGPRYRGGAPWRASPHRCPTPCASASSWTVAPRPSCIEATVHGDLEGPARLVLVAVDGTAIREVSWTVE